MELLVISVKKKPSLSVFAGNDAALFEINSNTGNITMLKPADVLGTITLTVLVNTTYFLAVIK